MNINTKIQYSQFKGTYDPFIKPLINVRANNNQTSPFAEEKDPAKKAKKWVIATVTGGTAFSILGIGLLMSYLSKRQNNFLVSLPLKLKRSLYTLEHKALRSDFDDFMIWTQKHISKGLERMMNGLVNFDQTSKDFVNKKLMGQNKAGSSVEKLNILQKFAVNIKNFFMKKAVLAAEKNYIKTIKAHDEMGKSLNKFIDRFEKDNIIKELYENEGLGKLIDGFECKGKTVKDLFQEIRDKNKEVYNLLSEKAKGFSIEELKSKAKNNPKLSKFVEDLEKDGFEQEFKEDILLRFVVAKRRHDLAGKKAGDLLDEFRTKRENTIKTDLNTLVEQHRQLLKELTTQPQDTYDYLTKTYNAENLWKEIRKEQKAALLNKKEEIARSIEDNSYRIKRLFTHSDSILFDALDFQEINKDTLKELRLKLRSLENIVDDYHYASGKDKAKRESLQKEFLLETENMISMIPNTPESKNLNQLIEKLNDAKLKLTDDYKGFVEEMRASLKYYCPYKDSENKIKNANLLKELYKDEYQEVKDSISSFSNSLRKAVRFEVDDYESRMRELALGAGIFELAGPGVATLFYANEMRKAESKEERISKSLTKGLPIAGGLGIWVYANLVKCVNGPKAIFLSLGTGLLFNKVGHFVDNNFYSKGREWNTAKALKDSDKKLKTYSS